MKTRIWMRASTALVGAAAAAMTIGCTPQPPAKMAVSNDKLYTVTPNALKVKAGIVTGEMTELKVMERVEEGSGRVSSPAKLTGTLVLKNVSADQTVRLLAGRITYVDLQGQPIKLEDNRVEPLLKLAPSSYGSSDRLDPGEEAKHVLEVEFPVEALKAKKLKDIRLGISYIPAPYKNETFNFPVSIGEQK